MRIPKSMQNMTEGLCGNNNDEASDDLVDSSGNDLSGVQDGVSQFGNSWKVPDPDDSGYEASLISHAI